MVLAVVVHWLSCPVKVMWDLPRAGIKSISSALAGRFLTTGPPGKPRKFYFLIFAPNTKHLTYMLCEEEKGCVWRQHIVLRSCSSGTGCPKGGHILCLPQCCWVLGTIAALEMATGNQRKIMMNSLSHTFISISISSVSLTHTHTHTHISNKQHLEDWCPQGRREEQC